MSLISCSECDKQISSESRACVHCGRPLNAQSEPERVIAEYKYSMFDAGPFWPAVFVAASITGIGIFFLIAWSVSMTPRPRLTVTNHGLKYRDMNNKTHVVPFKEITDIIAGSGPFQKLIGSGYLIIKREGLLKLSLFINGLSSPKEIKKVILKYKK